MRVNKIKSGEVVSPFLSEKATKVFQWCIGRGNARRAVGNFKQSPFEASLSQIADLLKHKYPYRGGNPAWISEGGLD